MPGPTRNQFALARDFMAESQDNMVAATSRLSYVAPCTEALAREALGRGVEAVAYVLHEASEGSGTLTHSSYLWGARGLASAEEILRAPAAEQEAWIQGLRDSVEQDMARALRAPLQVTVPVPTLLEPSDFARATGLIAGEIPDTEPKAPTLWDHLLDD